MTIALTCALIAVTVASICLAGYAVHGTREANRVTAETNRQLMHQIVALTSPSAGRQSAKAITPPHLDPVVYQNEVAQALRDMDPDYLLIGQDGGI